MCSYWYMIIVNLWTLIEWQLVRNLTQLEPFFPLETWKIGKNQHAIRWSPTWSLLMLSQNVQLFQHCMFAYQFQGYSSIVFHQIGMPCRFSSLLLSGSTTSDFLFKIRETILVMLLPKYYFFLVARILNCRGDLIDISAKTATLSTTYLFVPPLVLPSHREDENNGRWYQSLTVFLFHPIYRSEHPETHLLLSY